MNLSPTCVSPCRYGYGDTRSSGCRTGIKDKPLGERLRLALQELGPVWIKFGQMLSTRRDLFPPHIADQLALLQDKVAPFDGRLAKQQIEAAMGGLPVEAWFDDFDIKPLASASIAQVHTARLKSNGKEVVIKVIRPDILPVIKADLKLIYRLARWVRVCCRMVVVYAQPKWCASTKKR